GAAAFRWARGHVESPRRPPLHRLQRLADVGHVQHVVAVAEEAVARVVEDREARHEPRAAVRAVSEELVPLADEAGALRHPPVLRRRPAMTGEPRHRLPEETPGRLSPPPPGPPPGAVRPRPRDEGL